jgi:hypothetical protein
MHIGAKTNMLIQKHNGLAVAGLWFCTLGLVFTLGCEPATTLDSPNAERPADEVVAGTVELRVDYSGEKKNRTFKVPCSADSTVFSILRRAKNMGDLDFDSQGSGTTAFVHSIDGVMNSGRRGNNWVFRVNDQLAKESCGSLAVAPGDVVEWKFGEYEPDSNSD